MSHQPFHHLDNYWLSHSVGRPLQQTAESLHRDYLQYWESPEPWPLWLKTIQRFKDQVGELINAKPSAVCPQVNISSGLTKLLNAICKDRPKPKILLSEADFATISFVAKQVPNAELHYLPAEADVTKMSTWLDHLSDDLDVALITHVFSNTGMRAPVKEVVASCRERSIHSIIDIAQSVGIVPIDVSEWQCDAVIGTSVKWLSGGPGAAFMYVEPEFCATLEPSDVGWFSHQNPFEFDVHNFEYDQTSHRFLGGTPSVAPFAIAAASIAEINQLGVAKLLAHNHEMSALMMADTPDSWWSSPCNPTQRGGTLIFNPPMSIAERLLKAYQQGDIYLDQRETGFRLSPCWSNTEEDVVRFKKIINDG
ncbi:aminotransferase class V-fold PLP-dependent enzyme [Umboniibacter marinipuniceus]|uniref:Selenocysteine lyase/cysteine desulfurase n=1 Tax=Umboniibacter marinipuniceus TaxID=569599 RepID=A0A3M0A166_9GAMM|nr:aminotransferase class V-fold PLP-dependent enzyme [Umboniibacter marinipuniceus]RMA78901.1 selenocysteine lyase/cysteine desulfurase [Umboniibacter marinipuniceus]